MEHQQANSLASTEDQSKKKALASYSVRKAIAVMLGILALIIAGITVISNFGTIPRMLFGIASIYVFWFAIDYYHAKCPKCQEKIYIKEKNESHCPRCGWPPYK